MAKRKKFSRDTSSASEFEPTPSSSNIKSRRRRQLAAPKAAHSASRTELSESHGTPHSLSQHLISTPDLIRPPLLGWYSRVHTARGMPWRKPFDPSLDTDARAQRAYEVRDQNRHHSRVWFHIVVGLDFRDYAPANPGRYCDSLLQSVDGEVSTLVAFCLEIPVRRYHSFPTIKDLVRGG